VAFAFWMLTGRHDAPGGLLLFIFAVTVSAWIGGSEPGWLTTIAGTGASAYFLLPGAHSLLPLFQIVVFIVIALSITWITDNLRITESDFGLQLKLTNAITNNMGEGIYAVDQNGLLMFLNPPAERMLGWKEEELRGKDPHQVIHKCPDGDAVCPLTDVLRVGTTVRNDDDIFKCRDGTPLPVSYTSSPILTNGQITGAVLSFQNVTERKGALEALRASEEWHRKVLDTSPDSIWLTDTFGYVILANRRAAALYGYDSVEEMLGINATELIAPGDRLRSVQDKRRLSNEDNRLSAEYLSLRKDGSMFPVELSASLNLDEDGKFRAIIHVARDITERKQAEETLRSSEARLAMQYAATTVLAQAPTLNEAIPSLIQTMCELAGWDVGAFWLVETHEKVLRCRNVSHLPSVRLPGFKKASMQTAFHEGEGLPGEVWVKKEAIWVPDITQNAAYLRSPTAAREGLKTAFTFPVIISGAVHSIMEFYSFDVRQRNSDLMQATVTIGTEVGTFVARKQAEEALEYQAMHDALTDLPNRLLLKDRMHQAILSAERNQNFLSLLLMDLDHFKEVNDTYGHHYGDLLLQEVGSRLKKTLRDSDTVARLGGDEFAVILPAVDAMGAQLAASKMVSALEQPFFLEGQNFAVGCSIGIAVFPEHGENANTLLRRADVAMYVAKRGNTGFSVYAADQDEYSPGKLALKSELRHAIESGQLIVHYQPKADLKTGRVEATEALVRWQHPEHGLIPPDQFISLAEQAGLIGILSMHVLSVALRQCRAWNTNGFDVSVAVNLSATSLQDEQFVGMIAGMLRACDVPPHRLKVEITEGAVMTDPELALEILTRLHNLGVKISIDDFGTG
jgi:diguanylate cyclase (GGDEF)-like protein/PAS domain S-box-containing protein